MSAVDPVLGAEAPDLTADAATEVAARHFGIASNGARSLGSERDQTFLLIDDGVPVGVLKISNAAENPATLDMEALVIRHIARVDPTLPVARPLAHVGCRRPRRRAVVPRPGRRRPRRPLGAGLPRDAGPDAVRARPS